MSWSPSNCQSLLGYAESVHLATGGICAYCDFGKPRLDFSEWRQLALEHVVPSGIVNGDEVKSKLMALFGYAKEDWPTRKHQPRADLRGHKLQAKLAEACCTTACTFCNSMTSKYPDDKFNYAEFWKVFEDSELRASPSSERLLGLLKNAIPPIVARKRAYVQAKLFILKSEYQKRVERALAERRTQLP